MDSTAPKVFTNCLVVVTKGIHIYPDLAGQSQRQKQFQQETIIALECDFSLFSQLGILVNYEKSSLTPSQIIELMGVVINSRPRRPYLLEDRFCGVLSQ